jgi:DNA-binding LytR/AlgR family response regulator
MAKIKILIVEDELIIAQDVSFKLEDLGYQVEAMATNYEEAVAVIDAGNLDVILLDINLSEEKDGIDIANYINQNGHTPFIYMTSNSDYSTVSRAKETKPNGYILKPINKKDLFTSIEMALSNKQGEKQAKPDEGNDSLFVNHRDALVKINQKDILWLNAEGNYTKINTNERSYLVRGNLKDTQQNLNSQFCRIHKSYVVNLKHIDKIVVYAVFINDQEIPIGKMYKEEFLNRIHKL